MERFCYAKVGKSTAEKDGRGLFADRHLAAGCAIYSRSRPLVAVLDDERLLDTCSNCFGRSGDLWTEVPTPKACTQCQILRFCSKKCQKVAWNCFHKFECKGFSRWKGNIQKFPYSLRMTVQLMSMRKHGMMAEEEWQQLIQLRTNNHLVPQEFQAGNNAMIRIAQDLSGCHGQFPSDFPISGMLKTNRFSLTAPSYDSLGSALDLVVARINHSCDPNAYVIMDGPIVSVRTIRQIAEKEEIFITYVDTTEPYYMRQYALKTNWFFACNCEKCHKGSSMEEDRFLGAPNGEIKEICRAIKKPPGAEPDKKNFLGDDPDSEVLSIAQAAFRRHADLALKCANGKDAAANLLRVFTLWSHIKLWPEHRYPMLYVRNELVLANLDAGQRFQAMLHAAKIHFEIYHVKYPEPYALMRVMNEFRLVTLILDVLFDGVMDGSITAEDLHYPVLICSILRNLVENVDKSHGENSRFARMVKVKYAEFTSSPNTKALNAYYEVPENFEREKQRLLLTAERNLKEAEKTYVRSDEPLARQFERMEEMLELAATRR